MHRGSTQILEILFWSLLNILTWARFSCCPFLFFVHLSRKEQVKAEILQKEGRSVRTFLLFQSKQASHAAICSSGSSPRNHISKRRNREQARLFFFPLSPFSFSEIPLRTRATKALHHLNFCVALALYLPLFYHSLCNTLPSHKRVRLVYQAGIVGERSKHGSGTGAQRAFPWFSSSLQCSAYKETVLR